MATTSSENKNLKRKYIAFFDLDYTILSINSGRVLIRLAYQKGLLSKTELLRAFWFSLAYKLRLSDTIVLLGKMISWINGKHEKNLDDLAREVFDEHILNSIRDEIRQEINIHKENGATTVILSSSIVPICSRVADYLKLDDFICSSLEISKGIYTGRSESAICFGKEKAVRILDYCTKNSINPSESYYYGDSIDDLHALAIVGNPVCVSPDKKLKRAAVKNGWRILI